ncbi:hypothetical protein NIES21_44660 [Anabaenopsis circularis NIES-21]|uniref:Uncharacterized protein n=1 Tax=Anabaenopsis circularis NIES-21 TaxID=1085406 RepID=A0A1Z4GMP2_9CYAN|nr:hypothetical protein NIES21_44660 [Anabaenopsis circularis NIES-21]
MKILLGQLHISLTVSLWFIFIKLKYLTLNKN